MVQYIVVYIGPKGRRKKPKLITPTPFKSANIDR